MTDLQPGTPAVPDDDREPYGRIVNETRRAFELEREAARGEKGPAFYVLPWEQRHPSQQELDMRIGSAVAAQAVHDAGLRNERLEAQLFALAAVLPAVRRALALAMRDANYEAEAKPFRAALQALGISEEDGAS